MSYYKRLQKTLDTSITKSTHKTDILGTIFNKLYNDL